MDSPQSQTKDRIKKILATWHPKRRSIVCIDQLPLRVHPEIEQNLPLAHFPDGKMLHYLPIEYFRFRSSQIFQGHEKGLRFESSGTTDRHKAQAYYSLAGEKLYQAQSLQAFEDFLDKKNLRGLLTTASAISLIPNCEHWPTSSLAQMIAWFRQIMPVEYRDPLEHIEQEGRLLMGTGFHFVQLFDQGLPIQYSVVFETGGTKGRSRAVSSDEYDRILQSFLVDNGYIISEYGMSELACQAYRLSRRHHGIWRKEPYRFPPWVSTFIMDDQENLSESGTGLLTVHDPLRIDYPWPIRTEDLVELNPDGGFHLLGRAPRSPSKGCSLNVESISQLENSPRVPECIVRHRRIKTSAKGQLGMEVWRRFDAFLSSSELCGQLAEVFSDKETAVDTLGDLRASFPKSPELLQTSAHKALTQASPHILSKRCLFILPRSHPIAGLDGLLYALTLGIPIAVRVPQEHLNIFSLFARTFADLPHLDLQIYDDRLRFGERSDFPEDVSHIVVYGSNATIHWIQQIAPGPVQAFGDHIAGILADAEDLESEAPGIIYDATSLQQRGCMSARFCCVVAGKTPNDQLFAKFMKNSHAFMVDRLPRAPAHQASYHLTVTQLRQWNAQHYEYETRRGLIIAGFDNRTRTSAFPRLSSILSTNHPILPIIFFETLNESLVYLQGSGNLKLMTLSQRLLSQPKVEKLKRWLSPCLAIREIGQANRPDWDGLHQGIPYFSQWN